MDLSSGAVGAAEPKAIRALGKTVMADLGLYVWAPRGPASLSSLSQAAAILGWALGFAQGPSSFAQAGTCSERGSGPV